MPVTSSELKLLELDLRAIIDRVKSMREEVEADEKRAASPIGAPPRATRAR